MTKLFATTAILLTLGLSPAFAEGYGDKADKLLKMDKDGNGVVTKSEFLEQAEERFSKMDTDGNNEITKEEAQTAKEKMRARMKEHREKMQGYRGDSAE